MWSYSCCLLFLLACHFESTFARTTKIIQGGQIKFFEDQFKKTIICAKKQLAGGHPRWGIPPLDPWKNNKPLDLRLNNKYIITKIKLYDAVIDGLASSETVSLTLSPLMQLSAKYYFKKIRATASYKGEFNLFEMLGSYGDGIIEGELDDILIYSYTQYRMVPPLIGYHGSTISLGKSDINITGVDYDEDMSRIFSSMASEATYILVNRYQKEISDIISTIFKHKINSFIGDFTFLDFLAIVTQYSCD